MLLPAAIIFVNRDISDEQKKHLATQLFINETMTKAEFDLRVSADPNYPTIIKGFKSRILVILDTFQDFKNRELADVVLFQKGGLAYIENKGYGSPRLTVNMLNIDIYTLLRYNKSSEVIVLPGNQNCQCDCRSNCSNCHRCCCNPNCPSCGHRMSAIYEIQRRHFTCGVHAPNCNNETHNDKFINRK